MPLTEAFALGVACEVFGFNRSDGLPTYDVSLVAGSPEPIRTRFGYDIDIPYDLDRLDDADLIVVPAGALRRGGRLLPVREGARPAQDPLLDKLRAAVDRGAKVASLCSGAVLRQHSRGYATPPRRHTAARSATRSAPAENHAGKNRRRRGVAQADR
ncbi:MAG: hypothetical protein AAGC80_01920, partial [Rhodococcus sp. (in: high G+C Gram-positive bacteria)]